MIRSMTGYARVHQDTPLGELTVSVKSVNHRGLDLHLQLPGEFEPFENAVRALIKRHVTRGHVDVRASLMRLRPTRPTVIATDAVAAYVEQFREVARHLGLPEAPDLNAVLRLPGMTVESDDAEPGPLEPLLLGALESACGELNAFREQEGADLHRVLQRHHEAIQESVGRVELLREGTLPALQARLEERLAHLLRGQFLEPQRLAQEAAVLVDRGDISEELARLRAHGRQLAALLAAGGEVGKKLDFLMQEMSRETNTILSKTTGAGEAGLGITTLALAMKGEIEKVREQALNLE